MMRQRRNSTWVVLSCCIFLLFLSKTSGKGLNDQSRACRAFSPFNYERDYYRLIPTPLNVLFSPKTALAASKLDEIKSSTSPSLHGIKQPKNTPFNSFLQSHLEKRLPFQLRTVLKFVKPKSDPVIQLPEKTHYLPPFLLSLKSIFHKQVQFLVQFFQRNEGKISLLGKITSGIVVGKLFVSSSMTILLTIT
jgi:hypothetical protein